MSRYYIAYGSNLSEAQMRYRTPDARIIGTAELEGWRLLFKRHATVEAREGYTTPVLVWEISDRDERNLDLYEGFPHYYRKQELPAVVTPLDGGESVRLTAMVYIMADGHKKREPDASYYKVLLDGYRAFGFRLDILEKALADSIGRDTADRWLKKNRFTEGGHRDA